MSSPTIMNFEDGKVQAAIEQENAAKEDVKNARKAIKTGNRERKELLKQQKEQEAAENRNLKAAMSRKKAATQTKLALQGIDPVPKVGNFIQKGRKLFFHF
jgi:hypothetical protein